MANTPQARKRARQSEGRRMRNASHRSRFRTHLKKVMRAIEAGGKDAASAAYEVATPIIDAMVGRGLLHRNKAARHKSRMNAHIKALQ